jgi:hypothetical protein
VPDPRFLLYLPAQALMPSAPSQGAGWPSLSFPAPGLPPTSLSFIREIISRAGGLGGWWPSRRDSSRERLRQDRLGLISVRSFELFKMSGSRERPDVCISLCPSSPFLHCWSAPRGPMGGWGANAHGVPRGMGGFSPSCFLRPPLLRSRVLPSVSSSASSHGPRP